LAVSKDGDLYIILPDSTTRTMRILKGSKHGSYADYEEVWSGHGYTGEPLVDKSRLERGDGILSVFVLADAEETPEDRRNVVVLDFGI